MAQPYLLVSTLIVRSMLVLLRNPRGCPRLSQRNLLTLSNSMLWPRALPRTTTLIILMNLGLHLAEPRNILISLNTNPGPDMAPEARHRSPKPSRKTYADQDHPQHDPDPPYYREVALSDIPSQYAEEVDIFRRILKLPDPRDSLPRSSTAVVGLDDEKGRQELRPRGPSSMLPLNSIIKDAFDKFDQDFQAAYLPEGKYIRAPPSTAKWYKVGQPCYEDKMQELNTDFAKICISPKPFGAPMGKVPLPILKELEHQARQNISTLNFTTTFAKTSSSCNSTLEKCQHSLKSTFKKVKSQIRKGADPEKVAKRGYEEACEYLDIWNKTLIIQHRALTCLSKSLAHILQRELYSMGKTGLGAKPK